MSHENIQAFLYALYTLKPESSRVGHPHIYSRPRNMENTRSLIWDYKLWNRLATGMDKIRTLITSLKDSKHRIWKCDLSAMVEDDNCTNCIHCNS